MLMLSLISENHNVRAKANVVMGILAWAWVWRSQK